MKRNKYIILCSFLVLVLSSFSSCDKTEDFSVLPAETQSGNNTFGCYVEGKRFFGGYLIHFGIPPLSAVYHSKQELLNINADGKFEDNKQGSMGIQIFNPKVGVTIKMQRAIFEYYPRIFPGASSVFTEFGVSDGGEVIITKLDTINKIVSGRFSMIGKGAVDINNFTGSDSITIAEGRFDLKISQISNN